MVDKFQALDTGNDMDFWGNRQPKCPHCGGDFDIAQNDAWNLFDENETHEVTCPDCHLDFLVNSVASWSFSTDEQDRDDD